MKRLIALSCVAFLMVLAACNNHQNATGPSEAIEKSSVKIIFQGKIEFDGIVYESKEKTEMVLPEKYWPEKRLYTAKEVGWAPTEVNNLRVNEPDYYFTMYDGGAGYILLYAGSSITFTQFEFDEFLPGTTLTDFRFQPRTNILSNTLNANFWHNARLTDYRSSCSDPFTIFSPITYFGGNGWKIGSWSDWDIEGWTANEVCSNPDIWQINLNASEATSGVLYINKVVFHLQAI